MHNQRWCMAAGGAGGGGGVIDTDTHSEKEFINLAMRRSTTFLSIPSVKPRRSFRHFLSFCSFSFAMFICWFFKFCVIENFRSQ